MEHMATELLNDLMKRSSELSASERKRLALFLTEETSASNGSLLEAQMRSGAPVYVDDSGAVRSSPAEAPMRSNTPEVHSQYRDQYMAWLKTHREEYGGQYVALHGDRLVGSGKHIREAATAARQNGCLTPFLVYVPRPNGEYWGGWI